MAKILISLLGTGRQAKNEYEGADYLIDTLTFAPK
jgi:hypothetical protein